MPTKHSITSKKGKAEFFKEWKSGALNIGQSDRAVPNTPEGQKQAVAIYLSKVEQSKKKRKEKTDSKYQEGLHLSHMVPSNVSSAYADAVLEVLRGDAKKRIRVNDPRVKGGHYYRMQEVGNHTRTSTIRSPRRAKKAGLDKRLVAGIAGAALAGIAVGGAAGAGIAMWQSQQSAKQQVSNARSAADKQVEKEVDKAKQETADKYKKQAEQDKKAAESRLKDAVAKTRREVETQFGAELDKVRQEASAAQAEYTKATTQMGADLERTRQEASAAKAQHITELETVRKQAVADIEETQRRSQAEINRITQEAEARIQEGIAIGTAVERERLAKQSQAVAAESEAVQAQAKSLERAYKERNRTLEKSFETRSAELERAHQERMTELERTARQNEVDHANRMRELEENSRLEIEERKLQIENRVNTEALKRIEQAKLQAMEAARAEIKEESERERAEAIGSGLPKGVLLTTPENGIEFKSSTKRELKPELLTRDVLQKRFDYAVGKLVDDRHANAIRELASNFLNEAQAIYQDKGKSFGEKWAAMESRLFLLARREGAMKSDADDIKKQYRKRHRDALKQFLAKVEGRGKYDQDLIDEFDDQLTAINKEMQNFITNTFAEYLSND